MINIKTQKLQDVIKCGNNAYKLNTDYRVWLDFEDKIKKAEKNVRCLYDYFVEDVPSDYTEWTEAIKLLVKFYSNPNSTPNSTETTNEKLVDYIEDGEYIYSSFFQCYKIDLFGVKMHWHLFLALFRGLSEDTKIKQIMAYRGYKKSNKKPEQMYERNKQVWALPKEQSESDKELMKEINKEFWGC